MTSSVQPIIVSLGVNCEVRTVVREWEASVGRTRGNHFFDWNITNVWAIIRCLENNFENIFLHENLVVKEETDGKLNYIEDKGSSIYFHHTFSRVNNITDQAIVNKEYEEKSAKVKYLIEKFKELLDIDQNLVFVRRGDEDIGETITLLMALYSRRAGLPFVLIAVRSYTLEGSIPDPYFSHFRQIVLPAGDWTAEYWSPVFDLITLITNEHRVMQLRQAQEES